MLLFISWFFSLFTVAVASECQVIEGETIKINLNYSKECKGQVLLSCFQVDSNFRDSEKALFSEVLECTDSLFIENVNPALPRSVIAFMDENKNGELDLNFFGIPTEPYAISNGFRGKWREPNFEDSAEPSTSKEITLEFKYWKER